MLAPLRTAHDIRIYRYLRRCGFAHPFWTLRAYRRAGITLPTALALLTMETGNGKNVWGHDPVPTGGHYRYGAKVTSSAYGRYKRWRGVDARRCQGTGPTQLTWFSIQDRADAIGGCWHPYYNMVTGFAHLAALHDVQRNGSRLWEAFRRYNGSSRYADKAIEWRRTWVERIEQARL